MHINDKTEQVENLLEDKGIIELVKNSLDFLEKNFFSLPKLRKIALDISKARIKRLMRKENGLSDIIDTTFSYSGLGPYTTIKAAQRKAELKELVRLVKDRNPKTVMEIGTAHGGTLYVWSRFLNANEIISLDLGYYPKPKIPFFSIIR